MHVHTPVRSQLARAKHACSLQAQQAHILYTHQEQVPATTNAAKHARSERTTPPLPPRREKSSLSPHPHPHVKYLRALVRPGANQSAHGAGAARGRTPPYVPAGRRSAAHAAAPLAPAAAAREGGAERAQLNVRRQCHMVSHTAPEPWSGTLTTTKPHYAVYK